MDYKFLIELAVTIGGWGIAIGVYKQKMQHIEKEIETIKTKAAQDTDNLQKQINASIQSFESIKDSLNGLNTKMDLLLNGQIVNPWGKNKNE